MGQTETSDTQATLLRERDGDSSQAEVLNRENGHATQEGAQAAVRNDRAETTSPALPEAPSARETTTVPPGEAPQAEQDTGEKPRARRPWLKPLLLTLLVVALVIGGA